MKVEEINEYTRRTRLRLDSFRKTLELLTKDADKARRRKAGECVYCWYIGRQRIAGQAFTSYTCAACGLSCMWHNTGTPSLCGACALALKVCRRCMGDVNMRKRRLNPPLRSSR